LFLAVIYKIFGHNYDAVRFVQIIIFGLLAVVIYLLAKDIFGEPAKEAFDKFYELNPYELVIKVYNEF